MIDNDKTIYNLTLEQGKRREALKKMETQLEEVTNQLYFLNSQIDGVEKQLYSNKNEEENEKKNQELQQFQVYSQFKAQVELKVKTTFENYFENQKNQKLSLQNKQNMVKMEVSSVAIFKIENPHDYVARQWQQDETNNFTQGFSIPFECATFLIKKNTTIADLFKQATFFWKKESEKYTLADAQFNNVSLLFPFYAENFFSSHKETQQFAYFLLWEKNIYTNFLLDEQKPALRIPGRDESASKEQVDSMQSLINNEMENFVQVLPGLAEYQNTTSKEQKPEQKTDQKKDQKKDLKNKQNKGKVSIGWKILLLLMSATYLVLIFYNCYTQYNYGDAALINLAMINRIFLNANKFQKVTDLYSFFQAFQPVSTVNGTLELFSKDLQFDKYFVIFQVRTKNYTCNEIDIASGSNVCSYSIFSPNNADDSPIQDSSGKNYKWGEYKSGLIEPFSGILTKYDSGAYYSTYTSYVDNTDLFNEEKQQVMLSYELTKMVGMDLTFFDTSRRMFFEIYLFWEVSSSYQLIQEIQMINYKLQSESSSEQSGQVFNQIEYVQLVIGSLLSLILMYIQYAETKQEIIIKHGSVSIRRDFFEFILQLTFLYNATILSLQYISFFWIYAGPDNDESILAAEATYNLMQFAVKFQSAMVVRGILIILVGFNTLKLFQISESVALILAMSAKGAESIILIIGFAVAILLAFTFMFYLMLHQTTFQFISFANSSISVIAMFMIGNYARLTPAINSNPTITAVLTIFMFILFNYGTTVLINSVLQEIYRTISYRTDHLIVIKEFYAKIDEIKTHSLAALKLVKDKLVKGYQKLRGR